MKVVVTSRLYFIHRKYNLKQDDDTSVSSRRAADLYDCEQRLASKRLQHHNGAYRDHLLAISQRGAWTEWLSFFAVGVAEQARDAMLRGQKIVDLRQHYRDRVQAASQSVGILTLVDQLFLSPFITVPGVGRLLNVTPRAAGQNVQKLVDVGILRQTVPGQKTNRVFQAQEILALLEADMP